MYITFLARSPCVKTVSFFRNLPTFLPKPVESRNNFTSKARFLEFAFWGRRRALPGTVRTAGDVIGNNSAAGLQKLFNIAQFLKTGATQLISISQANTQEIIGYLLARPVLQKCAKVYRKREMKHLLSFHAPGRRKAWPTHN